MKHHRPGMSARIMKLIAYDPMAGVRPIHSTKKVKRKDGGRVNLAADINEQAKVVDTDPSDGQKEAGNYRKGHIRVHGLDISIENPRGSFRSGVANGKPWKSRLPAHYGYIRKTEGGDGQHVDVYLGPHLKSPHVFVVDQHELGSKLWDEHKAFIGFGSKTQAREAYHRAFSDGKGKDRIGHIETMTVDDFKDWLRDGKTTRPIKDRGHFATGGAVGDDYNTTLSPEDETRFQTWKTQNAPQDSGFDYDLRGAYRANMQRDSESGHMGDRFKKPNHPTFSDQSQYAVGDQTDRAGFWVGPEGPDQTFIPPIATKADGGRVHMADGGIPAFDATQPVAEGGPPPFEKTQPPSADPGKLSSAWQGLKSGATFNFSDELAGVRGAGPKEVPEFLGPLPARTMVGAGRLAANYFTGNDPEAVAAYEKSRDEERAANAAAKEHHPYIHAAGEIAGSLPAMALLPEAGIARGAGLGARMVQGATVGAEYGGLSGVGEGKDAGERALGAAQGIVSGIVGGGAAPVAGAAAGLVYDKFGKPIVNAARGAMDPAAEASRRLATALKADQELIAAGKAEGMTPQQWTAARQAGEPVTLADLGSSNTQALLRSAANTSPEGRAMLEKTINERFAGQSERVADEVRGLVAGGANAHKTGDQLVAEYDRARVPGYKLAFQQGDKEIVSPAIERLMGSPTFEQAMKSAVTSGKDRAITEGYGAFNPGVTVENGMIKFTKTKPNGVPQYPNLQYWDSVKKELDAVANVARRSGDKERADVAGNLAKTLRGELDTAVPSYGQVRGVAAQYFGESNALEAGQKLAGKKVDPKAIADVMKKMKPDERELFREGYASDWAGRVIGNISDSRDITKAMFNSPNERARALAVFGPAGVGKMEARMTLETIMDGARKAMGNSTTARQLIEAGLAGGALGGYEGYEHFGVLGGIAGTITGVGAGRAAAKKVGSEMAAGAQKLIGKVNSKTAALVAELLTSNDPRKLQQGLAMAQKNQKIADGLRSIADRIALAGQTKAIPHITIHPQGPVPGYADTEQQEPPRPIH